MKNFTFLAILLVEGFEGPQFCQTPREIVEKKADLYYFVAGQNGELSQISKGENSN